MSRRNKILRAVLIVAILIVTALPSYLLVLEKQVDAKEVVVHSFAVNYSTKGTLLNIQRVKNIYVVQYEDPNTNYTLLYVDGLWIELGSSVK